MSPEVAGALAELRQFNYDNIYTRDESRARPDKLSSVTGCSYQ
ncbi:MAG: hypothetical protein ACYDGY_02810 [Acidimicrobiales bacterium]